MKKTLECLTIILFLFLSVTIFAQPVNINLERTHILNATAYSANIPSGTLSGNYYWWWRADNRSTSDNEMWSMLKSSTSNFTHTNIPTETYSVNNVLFRLHSIGGATPGSAALAGTWPAEKNLTTYFQSFFQPTYRFSWTTLGTVIMTYNIPATNLTNKKFVAGTYSTDIIHNQYQTPYQDLYIYPNSWKMNIVVPAFTIWNSGDLYYSTTLNSNNFIGNDYEITLNNFQIGHTVPAFVDVKGQAEISFTPSGGGVASTRPLSALQITSSSALLSTKTLSNSFQTLNTTAIPVATGNKTSLPLKIKLSATDLANSFFNAGTYTFNLDIRTRNIDNSISDTKTISVTIITNTISDIHFKDEYQSVVFDFNTTADYQLGKSINMSDHINITNNRPFQIYVKSTSAYFTLNSTPTTIPVSIVRIENGNGETQVMPKELSTTPQNIINNANPVLNRGLSIKYTIPPTKTDILFNKPTGVSYITSVIYSFTNL